MAMLTGSQSRWMRTLVIIAGVALLLGIPSIWPYAYYQLLRWFVCLIAAYISYLSFEEEKTGRGITMVAVAILFNPIVPIYLSKEMWAVLDFVTAIIFFTGLKKHE